MTMQERPRTHSSVSGRHNGEQLPAGGRQGRRPADGRGGSTSPEGEPVPGDFSTALARGFARRVGELAARLGATTESVRWVRRAAFAASRATSAGHVCLPVARLARRYGATPAEARTALLASGVVSNGDDAQTCPLVIDLGGRLYLARYFDHERRLAQALVEHAAREASTGTQAVREHAAEHTTLRERLVRYFGPAPADGVDWQRAAAALALTSRLTIVSGGPGTGKTTTVVGMLAAMLEDAPELSIALAAPTGKAAQRMQEALNARAATLPGEIAARLPGGARTLHRLLGVGERGARPRHHRDNPLPYDVLVVDEASMIDVALAAQLVDALAPATRLVLLGDKDQLAAVEAGAVFAELTARPAFSARGLACIAAATGQDEAHVKSAVAAWRQRQDGPSAVDEAAAPFDDDAFFAAADDIDFDRAMIETDTAASMTSVGDPVNTRGARWEAESIGESGESDPSGDSGESDRHDTRRKAREAISPEEIGLIEANYAGHASADSFAIIHRGDDPLVDCVVWLERNYRFGLDSPIGQLSTAIRRGDTDAALRALSAGDEAASAQPAAMLDEDAGASLAARTVETLADGFARYAAMLGAMLVAGDPDPAPLFDALNAYRILSATRMGARGVDSLNALMAAYVRRLARVPIAPGAVWFPGRPVMIARNDYALGLFNGDIGIALPASDGSMRVYFRAADGSTRAFAPAALPPHDTAFAMTVHKSQGSEFDEVALVLPASMNRVLSRELIYTAVTRARARVRIVGSLGVLAAAIATPTRRDSGLSERMIEAATRRLKNRA